MNHYAHTSVLERIGGLPVPLGQPRSAAPKKTITVYPRNEEYLKKKGGRKPSFGVLIGLGEVLAAGVAAWTENVFACTQVGVHLQSLKGQIVNSGEENSAGETHANIGFWWPKDM